MTSAARGSLPPKLYYRIGEVAELVGVEPHVLRYWEREFRSIRPTKSAKGQRVYSRRDVENLLRVRELLYGEGFTIAGAKKRLQRAGAEPLDLPDLMEVDAGAEARGDGDGDPETDAEPDDVVGLGEGAPKMREQLLAIRSEIEALLDEIGAPNR